MSRSILIRLAAMAVILSPLAAPPALAATAPDTPAAARPPATKPFVVEGVRSARFGMTEDQVIAAAASDFGVDPKSARRTTNDVQGTTVISFTVPRIEPVPTPGVVSYIFGAEGHRLIHVNIVWATPAGQEDALRPALVSSALKLRAYFQSYGWPQGRTMVDAPAGTNAAIPFAGQDAAGGVVEIMLQGVAFSRVIDGQTVTSPQPKGVALLRVAYRQGGKPDVARLAPGSF